MYAKCVFRVPGTFGVTNLPSFTVQVGVGIVQRKGSVSIIDNSISRMAADGCTFCGLLNFLSPGTEKERIFLLRVVSVRMVFVSEQKLMMQKYTYHESHVK